MKSKSYIGLLKYAKKFPKVDFSILKNLYNRDLISEKALEVILDSFDYHLVQTIERTLVQKLIEKDFSKYVKEISESFDKEYNKH